MIPPSAIFVYSFKTFCVVLLAVLSCYQIHIFVQNEDLSVVNFKEFNSDDGASYPAISVCLHSSTGKIFDRNSPSIKDTDGGIDAYHEILLGQKDSKKDVPFSLVTRNLFNDFVEVFFTMSKYGEILSSWDSSLTEKKYRSGKTTELPFFRSYQDPYFLCMTKKIKVVKNEIINLESLGLTSSSLLSSNIEHLLVYIHEPGHLIQQFGKQVLQLSSLDFENATVGRNNKYEVSINQVDVLKRRNKPSTPCNNELKDEDMVWIEMVKRKVGCIPTYWDNLDNYSGLEDIDPTPLKKCNSKNEYDQLATTYLPPKHTDNGQKLYTGSCSHMEIISSVTKSDSPEDDLLIAFNYKSEKYRETQNIRAIGFINLISSIGGFIGLLIGFGLFQVFNYNHSSFLTNIQFDMFYIL